MKSLRNKTKPEETNIVTVTKTKSASKAFVATTSSQQSASAKVRKDKPPRTCATCKENILRGSVHNSEEKHPQSEQNAHVSPVPAISQVYERWMHEFS